MESSTIDGGAGRTAPQDTRPSTAVIRAVARAEGDDETELPPLYHTIDPDALDALFRFGPPDDSETRAAGTVTFHYLGYEVRVDAAGTVDVTEQTPQ